MNNSEQTPHLLQGQKVKTTIAFTKEMLNALDTLRINNNPPMSRGEALDKILRSYFSIYNQITEGSTIQVIGPGGSVREISLD